MVSEACLWFRIYCSYSSETRESKRHLKRLATAIRFCFAFWVIHSVPQVRWYGSIRTTSSRFKFSVGFWRCFGLRQISPTSIWKQRRLIEATDSTKRFEGRWILRVSISTVAPTFRWLARETECCRWRSEEVSCREHVQNEAEAKVSRERSGRDHKEQLTGHAKGTNILCNGVWLLDKTFEFEDHGAG